MAPGKSIRWLSLQHGGLEELRLGEGSNAIRARSAIVGQAELIRHGVFYELSLLPDWTFESLLLQRTDGLTAALRRSAKGTWFDSHDEVLPELEGCIDVDFEMTPFTNTLPIRRAPLVIGESRRFRMAYIPAATLEAFPAEQTYTRLSERVYRFTNSDGSFTADITVDEDGLVADYPGLFVRA